jgi:hypothetical protein
MDSLVRTINLVCKRRISALTAAQSLAQFDYVYPARGGVDPLLAGVTSPDGSEILLGTVPRRFQQ